MSGVKINGWAMLCWQGTALTRGAMIGGTTNHRLTMGKQMTERASGTQTRAREYLPGLTSWSLTVEKLVLVDSTEGADVKTYAGKLVQGMTMNVCLQIGLDYLEGTVLVESVSIGAPLRGKATANMTLRGTGALTKVDVENWGFTYTLPMAFDMATAQESETESEE